MNNSQEFPKKTWGKQRIKARGNLTFKIRTPKTIPRCVRACYSESGPDGIVV